MPREKGADEVFCRSCGEPIKKEAEICPNCGVRNEQQSKSSSGGSTSARRHDPSEYSTTVSDTWWYAIAAGTVLWAVLVAIAGTATSDPGTIVGLLMVVAWAVLPIATYFDMQYVRANGEWNPNTVLWVIVMAIWIVNILAGVIYLYRRHEVLGEP